MKYRPKRSPQSDTERRTQALAKGTDEPVEVTAELAEKAGFDQQAINRGRNELFEGIGTIDARVVVRLIDVAQARELLPLGLELAPQPIAPVGKHPVFLLFSHNVFDAWFGVMNYREMMVGVPYVQLEDPYSPHRGPFIYMPRLYLDADLPRRLGNWIYGFEKEEATIHDQGATYRVQHPDIHDPLATLSFAETGPPQRAQDIENFAHVRQLLEMPTISQASRIFDDDAFEDREEVSRFLATTIVYDFDADDASIQPITCEVSLSDEITPPGLPPGQFTTGALTDDELGSFRVKAPQVVSLPRSVGKTRYPVPAPYRKQRVVILGGGPAACAAAYYLALQRDRYDVTLYTQGWRLGGKCAAGRGPAGRIEEHGLHAFVGFYQNAFRTVREIYRTAGLDASMGDDPVGAAFVGHEKIGLFDRYNDTWHYFPTSQGKHEGHPGEIPDEDFDYPPFISRAVVLALRQVFSDMVELMGFDLNREPEADAELDDEPSRWDEFVDGIRDALNIEERSLRTAMNNFVDFFEDMAVEAIAEQIDEGGRIIGALSWLLQKARKALKGVYEDRIATDREAWFVWTNLDLVLTMLIGIVEDRATDFGVLDDWDFRAWLLHHGLDPRNAQIASINQVYETLFAHGRDEAKPDHLACGVALRWFMLVGFLYTGFPAYDFRFSCPQTMLTPYYKALRLLGAKVRFFHRVEELQVEGTGEQRRLTGVRMQIQATVRGGPDNYDPFVPGLDGNPPDQPDWPSTPHYDQLEEGDELRTRNINLENVWANWAGAGETVLRHGEDFDLCILGIPIGVFPKIAQQLLDPGSASFSQAWKDMVDAVGVTRPVSSQLWFTKPAAALYSNPLGLLTGYALPEPSFADFSHLLQWENWSGPKAARCIAYHTGSQTAMSVAEGYPLTANPEFPDLLQDQWRNQFGAWLQTQYRSLYDLAPADYSAFLGLLAVPDDSGQTGEERLAAQWFNVAVQPSDLYVLSEPKTTAKRLGQSESHVKRLFLCGDWTRTDLNCGCVEAATQSGMLCARAISQQPVYVWHPGF